MESDADTVASSSDNSETSHVQESCMLEDGDSDSTVSIDDTSEGEFQSTLESDGDSEYAKESL